MSNYQVLPFLDEAIHEPNRHYHNDFRSYVPIFDKQLIFDFNWKRYLTDDGLMQTITDWADEPNWSNKTYRMIPHFLLLGIIIESVDELRLVIILNNYYQVYLPGT